VCDGQDDLRYGEAFAHGKLGLAGIEDHWRAFGLAAYVGVIRESALLAAEAGTDYGRLADTLPL
jgi:hypothetical protein